MAQKPIRVYMEYLTAKETRVEKAWNKRGLAGLRSELLQKLQERDFRDWTDETVVKQIANLVYSTLPEREWDKAEQYIEETCGVVGIDFTGEWSADFYNILSQMRISEESLREEVGDE